MGHFKSPFKFSPRKLIFVHLSSYSRFSTADGDKGKITKSCQGGRVRFTFTCTCSISLCWRNNCATVNPFIPLIRLWWNLLYLTLNGSLNSHVLMCFCSAAGCLWSEDKEEETGPEISHLCGRRRMHRYEKQRSENSTSNWIKFVKSSFYKNQKTTLKNFVFVSLQLWCLTTMFEIY